MTAAALVCGSCGTEVPPNSKFCNRCGAAVATATTHAEYKQVTVLFADVVHSTDIAAAVGAERLREIMAGATCAWTGGSTRTCFRASKPGPRASGPGAATATVPYRYCVKPSTTCSMKDSSGLASGQLLFWWRRCWIAVPTATSLTPRPRSSG